MTWVKWKLILVRLEIVFISAQDRCTVVSNVPRAWNSFWTHPMVFLGDVSMSKLISVRLEIVLISTHDRCMVCAKHTIGLEIILGGTDGTPT